MASSAIAVGVALLASLPRHVPGLREAERNADYVMYDALYGLRRPVDLSAPEAGRVVIVTVDQKSLDEMSEGKLVVGEVEGAPTPQRFHWPWRRDFWALALAYFQKTGAKAVVFDLIFSEPSVHENEYADDDAFAAAANAAREAGLPVVFATNASAGATPGPFALSMVKAPVEAPRFGAVNYDSGKTVRDYRPLVAGLPSLGLAAAAAATGRDAGSFPTERFLLHYYGPHQRDDGGRTFSYVSAGRVIAAALAEQQGTPADFGVDPARFRGRIVLIGTTADALFDLKSSPLSTQCPGVEVHATAVENLLRGQRVRPVGAGVVALTTLLAALGAALGVTLPRQTWRKLLLASLVGAALIGAAVLLFRGDTIRWLPLAAPLGGAMLSTVAAFAWSYLTEGRQRQLIFRALSQTMSPEMAEEMQRNPDALNLGGTRREMTVMFTDIAGFTDLSESMDVEKLTELMNYYLGEMSAVVLRERGFVDKYIGDAIMSFWNTPLVPQTDHAARACRVALGMQRKEREMKDELARRGAVGLLTRIGVNTGPMALGNMGSSLKIAYTVMGDAVNLGSRLEGANKLYGSQILMAQSTADQARDQFIVRQLDLLRVKGKKRPMAVYELLGEKPAVDGMDAQVAGYERGLRCYHQRKWDEAEAALVGLLRRHPDDAPAAALLDRVRHLREEPPPPEWDGVYVAKSK